MNCLDCASLGNPVVAAGVCADCGAGVCHVHAEVSPRWLTRIAVIDRVVKVEPPGRILRCLVCLAAHDAVEGSHYREAN